jgi:Icc-related predicted phosphoesterase
MTPSVFFVTDIHLKISEAIGFAKPFEVPDADVCVVAGDVTDRMLSGMEWVAKNIGSKMPVVMALGNHDFYGQDMPSARRKAFARAADLGIHLLDDSEAVVCGVRFVGGTLWTDFKLFESLSDPPLYFKEECMRAVRGELADYEEIYANEVTGGVMARTLTPRDTVRYHEQTVACIDDVLSRPFDGPTVVVTHHAPHPRSIHQRFLARPSSAAYASDLSWLIERHQPEFWLHGHVHDSFDYMIDDTRIICNPRGYGSFPNHNFNASLVISVTRRARPDWSVKPSM